MKKLKKALKVTGITFVILLLLAFLIPVIFKKQITTLVKKEINHSINATVDFKDVSLSLFRHFPNVTIGINDLSVVGVNEFAKDTLIAAKRVDLTANLISVIKGKNIDVRGAFLQSPRIHALVNKEGKANWDIAKESQDIAGADTTSSSFNMTLKSYSINDGYIEYRDETSATFMELVNVNHSGSGDINADEFTLQTKTGIGKFFLTQEGIPYFNGVTTDAVAAIKINTKTSTYTFDTDDITLNDLKLKAAGFFQLVNDSSYAMDIKFDSPGNQFKDILSLIPSVYKKDFDKIKTSGEAVFNGFVKGTYSPSQMPAYDVKLAVKNGFFQYPDLPQPVKNIQLDLHASNTDGKPDNAVIDISKGHVEMGNEPFDFKLIYKNPETAQYIDALAKGKLDLSQVAKFIKLEDGTKLAGLVSADAYAKGNLSAIEKMQGPFAAGGFFNVSNLFYTSKDFPQPVKNGNMNIKLDNTGGIADNTLINISNGHVEVGSDPVDFNLQLSKPVSSMNFAGTAKGYFTLDQAKQFTDFEPGTSLAGKLTADVSFAGNKDVINKGDYDKLNLNGTAAIQNLKYITKDYPTGISVSNLDMGFTPSKFNVANFNGNYLSSNFGGNASLNNLISFLIKDAPLSGIVNASVDKMNLNQWMGTDENVTDESPVTSANQAFLVPANMDILVNAKAGQVTYDKVNYNNISGSLQLSNETVKLQNIRTEALDGTIMMNGSYSTKENKQDPAIAISYNVDNLDVQKTFAAFNTIRALMPIGQFLSGKLHSELTLTGSLKGNMMPDLKSLTGKGNLLLVEGLLKKFAPLEKIATVLQIDKLKSISIKDVKNYFEFTNGKVLVKPFTIKVQDIEMEIGGMHGLDQSMNYGITMKVPRTLMGTQGNNLINGLVTSATSKGIPVKLGETVNLNLKVGGSISNPSVDVNLKEVAGDAIEDLKKQAEDFAKEKVDSFKAQLKDTIAKAGDRLKDSLKQRLKDQIFGKDTSTSGNGSSSDTTKKQPLDKIKNTVKDLFNKKKKATIDSTLN